MIPCEEDSGDEDCREEEFEEEELVVSVAVESWI